VGVRSELKALELVLVYLLKVHKKSSDLRFYIPLPLFVDRLVLGEYLNLDKMLVSFKEREFFEQPLPGYLVVLLLFHHMLGYLHRFFKLSDHNIPGGQAHVVS